MKGAGSKQLKTSPITYVDYQPPQPTTNDRFGAPDVLEASQRAENNFWRRSTNFVKFFIFWYAISIFEDYLDISGFYENEDWEVLVEVFPKKGA
ncbi:hypothetical protein L596_001848 [Steinernema carpocapsae]|uniref:Uncharacterized protein n=1 Tax=Steinernema carpocapsae TaxID=34508 RepID=A0A4U8UMF0_STECR|nr:hypothetical protein L596_001848 [Steinernema carpocapsae]